MLHHHRSRVHARGVQAPSLTLQPNLLSAGRTIKGILEGDAVPQLLISQLIASWNQGRFPHHRLITTFPLKDINQSGSRVAIRRRREARPVASFCMKC
jgi:Zn-dependent alcohol dehydrogenase